MVSATPQILRRLLAASADRRERAAAILTIGAWGEDTTGSPADPDPAARACAAMAPGLASSSTATRTILRALLDPAAHQ